MDIKENDRKSMMMIVSSMIIFGTIGIFRRYIPLSSGFIAFSRGLLGGSFVLLFSIVKKKIRINSVPIQMCVWLVVAGAVMGINWMILFEAYNHTTVAIATLCYYMQPTIVILLSPILFKEKLTAKKIGCAAASIIGMVLVSGVIGGEEIQKANVKGILFGLGAALFYSAVVIMNKRIRGIDAYVKTTIQLLSAGLIMVPYLILTGDFTNNRMSAWTVILLITVGIVHTGFAYVLYFGSMDGLKAQSVALLSYIDPVAALLFSAIILMEPLNVVGMVGAILIIGSAVMSEVWL